MESLRGSVTAHTGYTIERALRDPNVVNAAKLLNLNLMRKGGTIYAQSHCFELSDLLVA